MHDTKETALSWQMYPPDKLKKKSPLRIITFQYQHTYHGRADQFLCTQRQIVFPKRLH